MARNKQHFMKGNQVIVPDGFGEDVKATRIRIGWSRSDLASNIKDPNGTSPSGSWIKTLEDKSPGPGGIKKISVYGYRGALMFLVKHGDSNVRARWRSRYEETPSENTNVQTSAQRNGDLVDRMLNAFDSLNEDDQWNICILTEKVAKASKWEDMMLEAIKDRG